MDPAMRRQKGYTNIPAGMVVRGGRRQSIFQPALHMSQRSNFSSSKGLRHTGTVCHPRGDWQFESIVFIEN